LTRLIVLAAVFAVLSFSTLFRRQKAIKSLEGNIRKLRTLAVRAVKYRRLREGDDEARKILGGLDKGTKELEELGCTLLGDYIEESQAAQLPTRWFVDADGTTFGWIAVAPTPLGLRDVAMLMTGGERTAITLCTPRGAPGLAQPPHVDRVVREGFLDLKAALAEHAKRKPADAKKVTSIDDAFAVVEDVRARTATWREAQAPDALLDQDLRAVLGRHYEKLGKTLAKRLASDLPEARVRA
jgi:hypothetical protein